MSSAGLVEVSLSAVASSFSMRLTERMGGLEPPAKEVLPPEEKDSVSISLEAREKLAKSMNGEAESTEDAEKTDGKKEKSNEYTAELERYIKQLQKQIKAIQEQIKATQEDQSLDSETKQTLLDQQYSQLATTQAMLLEAVENLIEAKRKFKEKVELDMNADE